MLSRVWKILPVVCWLVAGFCLPAVSSAEQQNIPEFLRPAVGDQPLELVSVEVVDIDTGSAHIRWQTNRRAYANVEHGLEGELSEERNFMNARTQHSLRLDNLKEGRQYSFRIRSWDDERDSFRSEIFSFRTEGTPAPDFESIEVQEISRHGAEIRWVTNIPVRAKFEAGYPVDNGENGEIDMQYEADHEEFSRHHKVELTNFYPDRQIFYRIVLEDERGRARESSLRSFKTRENNVAYGKPVVAGTFDAPVYGISKDRLEDNPQQRITNGDYSYMSGTANSGDPADTEQWFIIDLEELYEPEKIVVYWRGISYPRQYEIYGSQLRMNWELLAGELDAREAEERRVAGEQTKIQTIEFDELDSSYRFIKLRIPEGAPYFGLFPQYKFVQIKEFKFFSREKMRETGEGRARERKNLRK